VGWRAGLREEWGRNARVIQNAKVIHCRAFESRCQHFFAISRFFSKSFAKSPTPSFWCNARKVEKNKTVKKAKIARVPFLYFWR